MKLIDSISVAELMGMAKKMPQKHKINRKKWASFSFNEQMGNIGSEVGRTFSAQKRSDSQGAWAATVRALDLFDATVSSPKLSAPRRREILRAKEEYLDSISKKNKQTGVENYFMQFAIAARLAK